VTAPQPRPLRFIRKPEINYRTGLTDGQIRRAEDAGTFPRHVKLSHRINGWLDTEVDRWCAARLAQRGQALALVEDAPANDEPDYPDEAA
jgi:predicted DNA-binding transcriptional regulator AlpA